MATLKASDGVVPKLLEISTELHFRRIAMLQALLDIAESFACGFFLTPVFILALIIDSLTVFVNQWFFPILIGADKKKKQMFSPDLSLGQPDANWAA